MIPHVGHFSHGGKITLVFAAVRASIYVAVLRETLINGNTMKG